MKSLSSALVAHLAEECTTLSYLIKITRTDGIVLGMTNHDADIVYDGVTYKADGAFNPSALMSRDDLSTDNLSLNGMISDAVITTEDIVVGRYDQARCDMYVCNWQDLSQGVLQLRRGWLGSVTLQSGHYGAVLHGLHDRLQQGLGDYFTATCRHDFADSGCTLSSAVYSANGSVTGVVSATQFGDSACTQPDGWFDDGVLTWTSGALTGIKAEIERWDAASKHFMLWLPLPFVPAIGDSYSAVAGCDKRFSTCKNKFANAVNFGGFPHMPGVDKILTYPDSKA